MLIAQRSSHELTRRSHSLTCAYASYCAHLLSPITLPPSQVPLIRLDALVVTSPHTLGHAFSLQGFLTQPGLCRRVSLLSILIAFHYIAPLMYVYSHRFLEHINLGASAPVLLSSLSQTWLGDSI